MAHGISCQEKIRFSPRVRKRIGLGMYVRLYASVSQRRRSEQLKEDATQENPPTVGVLTFSSFFLVPSCPLSERGRGCGCYGVSWVWGLLPIPVPYLARERCRRHPGYTTRHSREEESLVLK
jgi:hypothetical protein